ncbi:MAG: zf-HC2 domain-containing protein [Acidobacteriota bacterium]|nr:zf-HC2 domain-containing protein [Acidobacteriota bacterium]
MDHNEAIQSMAVERYLLNDLPAELRDEFEEHLFDCPECALDLRTGAAFIKETRAYLPTLIASTPSMGAPTPAVTATPRKKNWLLSLQAVFAVPAFAALLAIVCYQNLSTIPHLRTAAEQPRILPWTSIHAGTRAGGTTTLVASRSGGAVLLIDLPLEAGYTSYAFDLFNSAGKLIWTRNEAAPGANSPNAGTLSLLIPGAGLQQGAYTLTILGVGANGDKTPIDRRTLELHFED